MSEPTYKSFDEISLFLNAQMISNILGVSPSSTYELMHEKDVPSLRIGSRLVVPKDRFQVWIEAYLGKWRCLWPTRDT